MEEGLKIERCRWSVVREFGFKEINVRKDGRRFLRIDHETSNDQAQTPDALAAGRLQRVLGIIRNLVPVELPPITSREYG